MKFLIALTLAASCLIAPALSIADGEDTAQFAFPWMAAIRQVFDRPLFQTCSGAIIGQRFVLSTAYCCEAQRNDNYKIIVGDWDSSVNEVEERHIGIVKHHLHPDYIPSQKHDDICVFELAEDLVWSAGIQPAALPARDAETPAESNVTLIGWGFTNGQVFRPDILQMVDLEAISDADCASSAFSATDDNMLCTYQEGVSRGGSCSGDEGAPLTLTGTNTLVGLMSWRDDAGACPSTFPDVYVEVSKYEEFIAGILAFANVTGAA